MLGNLLKSKTAIAVVGGWALAGSWFVASSLFSSNLSGNIVSTLGAVFIAAIAPILLLKSDLCRNSRRLGLSMTQRLEALNNHASINIVNEKDQLIEVNEKLLELTGYSRDELIGQSVRILYDASTQGVAADIRDHLKRKETWRGETPLRRKDGSVLFMQSTIMPLSDEAGNWTGSISARTDVTLTRELIAERQTAQTLYELRDDIWIIDSKHETLRYMNRAAKARFNLIGQNRYVKNLADFNQNGEINAILRACHTLQENGDIATELEMPFMGTTVHVSINLLPETEDGGQYLILFRDISERIEQESAKSAFISLVSHELRSPLTSIKGAMGLVMSGSAGKIPDKALDLLGIAHRNTDRLILIINDLLDLEKISNGQLEIDISATDLSEVIKETARANAMSPHSYCVKVELVGIDSPVVIQTDPNRFIQILTNLLSNAYKFSQPNGLIRIEVQDESEHVKILVHDEGQGIPEKEQHKVFERFVDMSNSNRASNGGTGLGLSICKAILERMGGTIGFETQVGIGTTFYFTLPKTLEEKPAVDVIVEKCTA